MFRYTAKKLARDIDRAVRDLDPSLHSRYEPSANEVQIFRGDDDTASYKIFLGNLLLKVAALPRKDRRPSIDTFLREALQPKELSA
ncbi:MAG: hypothetical protein AAFU65_15470, partial [Pseudomonadota bacterium]